MGQYVRLSQFLVRVYDTMYHRLHQKGSIQAMSNAVLVAFLIGLVYSFLTYYHILPTLHHHTFLGIEIAFNVLLILEILGLIFVFAHSVADSIGKQFELISLILLRNAFKDFGHLPEMLVWDVALIQNLLPIFADALGAVCLFFMTGLFYRLQKHAPITSTEEEYATFLYIKKIISLLIFMVFMCFGLCDLWGWMQTSQMQYSFNKFFTILIFTDIFILLYSLRYTTRYRNVFRYSSFALTTVILRMTLTAPVFINVLLALLASLFSVLVTLVYNYLARQETRTK